MIGFSIVLLFLLLFPILGSAEEQMLSVAWRPVLPGQAEGSFEASTRTVWRFGDTYLRVEEGADPNRKIHGRLIVAEPDE